MVALSASPPTTAGRTESGPPRTPDSSTVRRKGEGPSCSNALDLLSQAVTGLAPATTVRLKLKKPHGKRRT